MKKIFIIILTIVLFGFTSKDVNNINYSLEIDSYYKENIEFILPNNVYEINEKNQKEVTGELLETRLLYKDLEPINSNHTEYYNKTIDKNKNNVIVALKYNYNEDDFMYANFLTNCFEKYKIDSKDDYFEINLSGKFYCLNDKSINIEVRTSHQVLETNGTYQDDSYNWKIDKTNYQNILIKYKIKRDYRYLDEVVYNNENKKNATWNLVRDLLILGIVFGLIIIGYKFLKKKNYIQ